MFLFSKPPNYDQKRKTQRVSCKLATICEQGKAAFNATVVDLGSQGMRLIVPRKLKAGTRLNVSAAKGDKEGKSVTFEVRWCRQKRFTSSIEVGGLYRSALEGSWVERALRELGMQRGVSQERRRSVRAPVNQDFTLSVQINSTLPGKVENLSVGGAQVVMGHPLGNEILDVVLGPYYHLKALKLKAEVVHEMSSHFADTWFYGLTFCQITPAQRGQLNQYVEHLLKAQAES